jgi:hypothetical protein
LVGRAFEGAIEGVDTAKVIKTLKKALELGVIQQDEYDTLLDKTNEGKLL